MGAIEDIYADLDADVSEEEFREAVEAKVEQMGGLADEETAAMLVAHELTDDGIDGIADIEAGMEEVKFLGKVVSVGELRTFERDGEDGEGHVCNVEVADETGRVRVAMWDDFAVNAVEELDPGDVLRIKGRPKEGYNGLEVSASRVEGDQDADIDVDVGEEGTIGALALGQNDVNVRGKVLGVEPVRTFDRDDGSEGRVANAVLGDETGKVRLTLWDEQADTVEELAEGISVEVVDGYVRERDGTLELHVGSRGKVTELDDDVAFVPATTDIADLELGDTVDIAGVVRSADPKRTFDRDDGSEGQVRNVRLQDRTGDIRVALWGDHADRDLGPGDEVLAADVDVKDGWQDDLEASAGWRSTITVLDDDAAAAIPTPDADVAADAGASAGASAGHGSAAGGGTSSAQTGTLSSFANDSGSDDAGSDDADDVADHEAEAEAAGAAGSGGAAAVADSTEREVTGTVVQTGEPVMLDTGEETVTVDGDVDVHLGQEVTVRGTMRDGRLDPDDVF